MKIKQPLIILFASLFFLIVGCNETKKVKNEKKVVKAKVSGQMSDEIFYLNYDIKKYSIFQPIHIDVSNQFTLVSKIGKNIKGKRDCEFKLVEPIDESISTREFKYLKLENVEYKFGAYQGREGKGINHTIIFHISKSIDRNSSSITVPFPNVKFKKNDIIDVIIKSSIKQINHNNKIKNSEYMTQKIFVDLGNHICRSIVNDDDD